MNEMSSEPDGTVRNGLTLESDSMGKIWVPADRYWAPKLSGYDEASEIARLACNENLTLKETALRLGYVSAEEFDRIVDPRKMATQGEET
jgi:fumarate hydratase class II